VKTVLSRETNHCCQQFV